MCWSCPRAREDTYVLIERRMKFKALCNRLEEENFISCLLVILEYACSLMLSHYQMSKWHDDHDKYDPLRFLHRLKRCCSCAAPTARRGAA